MKLYHSFASIYADGPYTNFSLRMAEFLPDILSKFDLRLSNILDIACGEGSFAIEMARKGYQVTGLDLSLPMLQIAGANAKAKQVDVSFINQDMRAMTFNHEFDLVTCWYDSLNYLLTIDDLQRAFDGAARAIKKGGIFIFDINTIYGISVIWQRNRIVIEQDTPDVLEIHRMSFDKEKNNAEMRITGFAREGELWNRIDEIHTVHGFDLEEIHRCAKQSGFKELACWGDIRNLTPPTDESGKILFVLRK